MASEIGLLSRKVLRELCTDSRVSLSELQRRLEVPSYVISRHIKKLEEELGLRYTLNIDYEELGFRELNVYHVTFKIKKPDDATLTEFLAKSGFVQLAIKMKKGSDFDLVVFALSGNEEEFAKWNLSFSLDLSKYGVDVNKSDIDIVHHGFIPLNEWAIKQAKIPEIYKRILLSLNEDSRQTIRDLAKHIGLKEDLARYYLQKLTKMKIIRQFTTILLKPPQCVNVLMFMRYVYREGHVQRILNKRKLVYFKKEDQLPLFNEYQMVTSVSGGEQDFAWGSAPSTAEAEAQVKAHASIFSKDTPTIISGIVDRPLKGYLPIRSINLRQWYRTTEWALGQNYT